MPNYKHRWWITCFVAGWILVFAILFFVQWQAAIGKPTYEALLEPLPAGNWENYVDGLREELVRCRGDLEEAQVDSVGGTNEP